MKHIPARLMLGTLLLLSVCARLDASLMVVQHTFGETSASQTTVAITVTATGSGNLLVVGTGNNGTRTVTGVSDGTNNFTQYPSANGVQSNHETDVWYLASSTSGATTITVTFSGAAGTFSKEGWFWEVSGFTSPGQDVAAVVNNGVGSGTTDNGASVTTTATTGFGVGIVVTANAIATNPIGGNEFTSGGDISSTMDAGCSLISSTAAAHQPAWEDSSSGTSFASSTAFFKESSGGASNPPLRALIGVGR